MSSKMPITARNRLSGSHFCGFIRPTLGSFWERLSDTMPVSFCRAAKLTVNMEDRGGVD